jgi:hypothetical protein
MFNAACHRRESSVRQRSVRAAGACGAGLSRRGVLLGGLAGLAAAGCGHSSRPTIEDVAEPASGEPTKTDLAKILDRRAKALAQGDERGFLADLDESNRRLVDQQRMVFANLRQFTFTSFHYNTERIHAVPNDKGTYRFGPVYEVTQLTADAGPGGVAPASTFRYSLAKKGGKLVVTEILGITASNYKDVDFAFAGLPADAPWYTTPLKVIRAHDVWLAGDDSVPDLDRYASAAGNQVRKVENLWGDRTRFPGYVLFFTRENDNYDRWFSLKAGNDAGGIKFRPEGSAAALSGIRRDGSVYSGQFAAARIVVNLNSIAINGDSPELVMRHELAHAVTSRAKVVGPRPPVWAIEGFARWMEAVEFPHRRAAIRADVASGVAAGKFPGKPPGPKMFYGDDASFNYDVSSTVFAFAEQTTGRSAAIALYAGLIQFPDFDGAPLVDKPVFDEICRAELGTSGSAFLRQWASFVRRGA